MPKPPEFLLPRRRGAIWWAVLASVVIHVLVLSVRATDWFWSEGFPPQVEIIPLAVDIPPLTVDQPLPERAERRRPPPPPPPVQPVEQPVERRLEAPPAEAPAALVPGVPGAPRDTAGEAVVAPGETPRGIPRLRPSIGEGVLWVAPLPLPPEELAKRLTRSHYELVDSAVSAIVQAYIDSILTAPAAPGSKPPEWLTKIGGKTFGIDSKNIHLGGVKIPTALLALLPIPPVGNVDLRNAQKMSDIRSDLLYASQRAETMEDFKHAIKEIRERREREQELQRNQRRSPADTTKSP